MVQEQKILLFGGPGIENMIFVVLQGQKILILGGLGTKILIFVGLETKSIAFWWSGERKKIDFRWPGDRKLNVLGSFSSFWAGLQCVYEVLRRI